MLSSIHHSDMGLLLQEHKFWEESFKVYEKGVAVFKYPHVRDIWLAYLQQFVKRYGGDKLERARDLFKQALREVLPQTLACCSFASMSCMACTAKSWTGIPLPPITDID